MVDGVPSMKMNIDGVLTYVSLTDVQNREQKETAVESRFKLVSEREKNLEAREVKLRADEAAALSASDSPLPSGGGDQSGEGFRAIATRVVDDMLHGDPDKAVDSLAEALQSGGSSTILLCTLSQTANRPPLQRNILDGLRNELCWKQARRRGHGLQSLMAAKLIPIPLRILKQMTVRLRRKDWCRCFSPVRVQKRPSKKPPSKHLLM